MKSAGSSTSRMSLAAEGRGLQAAVDREWQKSFPDMTAEPPCCRMARDGIQTPSCSIPTFASKLCDFARHPRLKAAFHTRVPAGRKNKSKQSEAKQSNAQHCKAKQRKAAQSNTNQSGVLFSHMEAVLVHRLHFCFFAKRSCRSRVVRHASVLSAFSWRCQRAGAQC